jgi:F1F0 ATPase subunit 2
MQATLDGFAFAGLAGLALGVAYSAALWSAVRRLADGRGAVRRLLPDALLRSAAVAAALLLIMDGQPERMVGAMLGFMLARSVATRWAQAAPPAR